MGLIMASWGLGPALAAVVVSLLLDGMGWQNGFIALGIGSAAIMFVLIGLFRDTPADKGIQPYGYRPGDVEVKKRDTDPERTKLFNGYMRKTAAFWNMSSIHFLGCVGHAIILVYIVPLAVKEGLTLVQAASVLTVLSAVSILTRVPGSDHVRLCRHQDGDVRLLRGAGDPGSLCFSGRTTCGCSTCSP